MGLYTKIFRPWPPIRDAGALADFIDEQAAFVAQKGIYEYSRARAGHYAKVLFREQSFQETVERCRWQAYPLGPGHGRRGDRRRADDARRRWSAVSCWSRWRASRCRCSTAIPTPEALGAQAWRDARAELERRLQLIGLHPPKRAKDIPEPFADNYFALMPIHKKLRGTDYGTTKNYLKVTLCNIHDELTRRIDAKAVADALGLGKEHASTGPDA